MSVVTRLVAFVREVTGSSDLDPSVSLDVSDDRLATAALLIHVARVDGRIDRKERDALGRLLLAGFALSPEEADALIARADRFDAEVDDIAALVEMLGHDQHRGERQRLLAMGYAVAAADGSIGEFEADLLWRMGCMLGFDERAIEAARTEAFTTDRPEPDMGA